MFGIMQKSVLPFVPNGDISLPEPLTLHLGMLLVQGYLCQNLWGKTFLSTLLSLSNFVIACCPLSTKTLS